MNIAQLKQVGQIDSWVDFDGEITEIKELKQRTQKNRLMQKVRLRDSTGDIGAWIYADIQQCKPHQVISANGMLKEYKDVRYLDYATVKDGQQAPPQPPQAPQNPAKSTNAQRNGRDISIERQAAFKAACTAWEKASEEAIIKLAIAGHYFIETGNNIHDIPEPDPSITEQGNQQTNPEDDIPF